MKYLLLVTCLVSSFAYSQETPTDSSKYSSEAEEVARLKRRRKELSVESLGRAGYSQYTTTFVGMRLNFSNNQVQKFMSRIMEMGLSDNSINGVNNGRGYIEESYFKKVLSNEQQHDFNIKYFVHQESNEFIIDSCEINGYCDYVVDFYVKFWNTRLSFEEAKSDELVVNHLLGDRISLNRISPDQTCKIVIEGN